MMTPVFNARATLFHALSHHKVQDESDTRFWDRAEVVGRGGGRVFVLPEIGNWHGETHRQNRDRREDAGCIQGAEVGIRTELEFRPDDNLVLDEMQQGVGAVISQEWSRCSTVDFWKFLRASSRKPSRPMPPHLGMSLWALSN